MKLIELRTLFIFGSAFIFFSALTACGQGKPWVTAYIGGWELNWDDNGYLPLSAIDFTAITVADNFSILPSSSGSFIDSVNGYMTAANAEKLIAAAHAAGTKVTVTIGAWATEPAFRVATDSTNLHSFVSNLASYVRSRGYDGIDIDWEPFTNRDTTQYENFIIALRAALPRPYLVTTTAAWGYPYKAYAAVQDYLDQINIMTYDLAIPSIGWGVWFAGATYNGGATVPGEGIPFPACDNISQDFIDAGVQPSKLGIGSEMGGCLWQGGTMVDSLGRSLGHGVTGPRQEWEGYRTSFNLAPKFTPDIPLYDKSGTGIMQKWFLPQRYAWDSDAQASYLSYQGSDPLDDYFISYDDSNDIKAKFDFIRKRGLGGIIIYELGMGYPGNHTFPMLSVIKAAMLGKSAPISLPLAHPILQQNYPNPFNPTTNITFDLPMQSEASLHIYNTLGQLVETLFDGFLKSGPHTFVWDSGGRASGVYLIVLHANGEVLYRKMLLLR